MNSVTIVVYCSSVNFANINAVAMLMGDALLHHYRKGMYHGRDRQLHTLISYVLLVFVYTTQSHVTRNTSLC